MSKTKSPTVCCDCQTRMALFPVEDQGFSITIDGRDAPICRDCVKDMIVERLNNFEHPKVAPPCVPLLPIDVPMDGLILEAYSEVVPA